jgi:hypothetical protein
MTPVSLSPAALKTLTTAAAAIPEKPALSPSITPHVTPHVTPLVTLPWKILGSAALVVYIAVLIALWKSGGTWGTGR